MSFWCDNKLTITGPNRELVLNAVKRETTDEGEPLTIFFSLEALRRSAEAKHGGTSPENTFELHSWCDDLIYW